MEKYFAVHIRTKNEIKVKNILLKNFGIDFKGQGVQIIVPNNNIDKANLPGYLIIKCRELTDDLYYKIKSTVGVIKVIRETIPEKEMQYFFNRVKQLAGKYCPVFAKELASKKGYINIMFKRVLKNKKVEEVNIKKIISYIAPPILHYLN